MAANLARLGEVQMDKLQWTLVHLEVKVAKASLVRTTRKRAKPVAKHMQVHVGMGTKVLRAKTKEKENQTRKEKIPKGKLKKENLKRTKNAVSAETNTLSRTAGIT